ncbi:MAG TPA: TonB-dependent receptor [Chryseosolibacter sp.]
MLHKLETYVFLLCVLLSFETRAQKFSDSTRYLKPVVITQSRLSDHIIASYLLPVDSTMLSLASSGSVTDLLRKQGLGHIRTYGPGGLASPSFRGSGSSHTSVLWNGINLVSPLNGQLDLSLLPAGLFDEAIVQSGGSTSLSGNGSIGGNIHLNNTFHFNEGLRISGASHIGSFGSEYYDAGVKFSNSKLGTSTKIFVTQADNDFKFENRSVFPAEIQRRAHSAFQQHGLLQQLHYQTPRAGIFSLKFWYQDSEYEIPNPTAILRASEATEENEFYRVLGGWNFSSEKVDLSYQGALITQRLIYSDPVLDQYSDNRYKSIIQNIEANLDFRNKTQLTSGIHYTWEEGLAVDFGNSTPTRNRFALFSAWKINTLEKVVFSLSGREEIVNGTLMPFAPQVSANYQATPAISIFTTLSRNYRIPTFNDLYWKGGSTRGNPNLKTETSLSAEAGLGLSTQNISIKSVAFTNHVDDWILWSPINGHAWEPQNIKKVWSRGIETQLSAKATLGTVRSSLSGLYSFTRSTNEDVYANGNSNEEGKQLILTPMHEGSLTLEVRYQTYSLRLVNTYTGEQFNDSDNTPYNIVEDYLITNLWLSKVVEGKRYSLNFIGEVNNLLNVQYVARPGYPMPGRNFKIGIQLNFYKPIKV